MEKIEYGFPGLSSNSHTLYHDNSIYARNVYTSFNVKTLNDEFPGIELSSDMQFEKIQDVFGKSQWGNSVREIFTGNNILDEDGKCDFQKKIGILKSELGPECTGRILDYITQDIAPKEVGLKALYTCQETPDHKELAELNKQIQDAEADKKKGPNPPQDGVVLTEQRRNSATQKHIERCDNKIQALKSKIENLNNPKLDPSDKIKKQKTECLYLLLNDIPAPKLLAKYLQMIPVPNSEFSNYPFNGEDSVSSSIKTLVLGRLVALGEVSVLEELHRKYLINETDEGEGLKKACRCLLTSHSVVVTSHERPKEKEKDSTYPIYPDGITHFVIDALLNDQKAFSAFLNKPLPLIDAFPGLLKDELLQAKVGLEIVPRSPISVENDILKTSDGYHRTEIVRDENGRPKVPGNYANAVEIAKSMAKKSKGKLHPYIPLNAVSDIAQNWEKDEKKDYFKNFDEIGRKFTGNTHIAAKHVDMSPAQLRDRGYDDNFTNERIFSSLTVDEALRMLCLVSESALQGEGFTDPEKDKDGKLFIEIEDVKGYAVEAYLPNKEYINYKYSEKYRSKLYLDPKETTENRRNYNKEHNDIWVIPAKRAIAYFHTEGTKDGGTKYHKDPMYIKTMFTYPIEPHKDENGVLNENVNLLERTISTEEFNADNFVQRIP
ncbi:MAG: hypothetical protein JWO24_4143 [Rhodospirillales bacterium]|nr:hypothetical protein [Rhodospirillales bacterium]